MKKHSLLEQYKFSLKVLSVAMPIMATFMLIVGVILSIALQEVFWVGLIVVAIGLAVLGLFILIKRFLTRKINEQQAGRD